MTTENGMIPVHCPVCGHEPTTELCRQRDLLTGRERERLFRLARCESCGLVMQSPRPAELGGYYEGYPVHASGHRPGWVLWLDRIWGYPRDSRLYRALGDKAEILEIGCGTAIGSDYLRRHPGWRYTGLEPAPAAVAVARDAGLNVIAGGIDQLEEVAGNFDLVYLNHVFEHLDDPTATLRAIAGRLSDRGVVQLVVPNIDSWEYALYRDRWIGLDLPRHLWVFSPKTIAAVADRSGYRVRSIRHSSRPSGWVGSIDFVLRDWGAERPLPTWLRRLLLILCMPLGLLAAALRRGGSIAVTLQPISRD